MISGASTFLKECNSLLFRGVALSCSVPTAWRYNLGRFGAQKFSYVLHYLCQATLSNPPMHVHGEFKRAVTRQLLGFLRGNVMTMGGLSR